MAALHQPFVLARLAGSGIDDADCGHAALRMDVPGVERHLDCAANRCLLAMLDAIDRRCREVQSNLEARAEAEQDSETVSELAARLPRWRELLLAMRRRLQTCRRRVPFTEVRRSEITAAGLNAVSAHPLYSRAWRAGWLALRLGADGDSRGDLLPLAPTWGIYEAWCFLALACLLREQFPTYTWSCPEEPPARAQRCRVGEGPAGERLTLFFQPTFDCTSGAAREGFWSISRLRIPDIVLVRERKGARDFVIFDAKYRVTRASVLEAMASAHVYRDALRVGENKPELALLLVPAAGGAPWLEDGSFVSRHRVGIVPFLPEADLPDWLCRTVVDFPGTASHGHSAEDGKTCQ
jgi:hypothetical protein